MCRTIAAGRRSRYPIRRRSKYWIRSAGRHFQAVRNEKRKVERAAELTGLGRETRRFTPHMTLGRTDRSTEPVADWLAAWGGLAAGPWTVEDFILYESRLGHAGVIYDEVVRYALRSP